MTAQDETTRLAEDVSAQVLAALTMYAAGQLSADALVSLVAALVAAGNGAAAVVGDLSLAAAVTVATGSPTAPRGITRPTDDADRLMKGAQTILDDFERESAEDFEAALEATRTRFERLAEAEVRKSAADAYSEAVADEKTVTGWTRGLEPDACELCTWWHREGRVWPADHPMPRHHGCDCSQLITVTDRPIRPVQR